MAVTEIDVFGVSPFNINNGSTNLEFSTQKNTAVVTDKLFSNEANSKQVLFNISTHQFINEITTNKNNFIVNNKLFINEININKTAQFVTENTITRAYIMRARKVSDNSFVYWSYGEVDRTGVNSGYQSNELHDICVLAVN